MIRPVKIVVNYMPRDVASIDAYLRDISKYPLLTSDEEVECSKAMINGDEKASNRLITSNLRFVVSVAKHYREKNLPLEDLINEGNEGLIIATKKFDPNFGFKFISYAVWHIRSKILAYKEANGKMIRIPSNRFSEISKLNKIAERFEVENGRAPSCNELLDLSDLDGNQEKFILLTNANSLSVVSFNNEPSKDADYQLLEVIENKNAVLSTELTDASDYTNRMTAILGRLTPKERDIIKKYYGILGEGEMNLIEISEEYDLSRERIRQIRDKAIRKLQYYVKGKDLSQFFFNSNND